MRAKLIAIAAIATAALLTSTALAEELTPLSQLVQKDRTVSLGYITKRCLAVSRVRAELLVQAGRSPSEAKQAEMYFAIAVGTFAHKANENADHALAEVYSIAKQYAAAYRGGRSGEKLVADDFSACKVIKRNG